MSEKNGLSEKDEWQGQTLTKVHQFAVGLRVLHQTNPWPNLPLLPRAMNDLMTELWDRGFSQTEIQDAFVAAVADMPRYTGGAEVCR